MTMIFIFLCKLMVDPYSLVAIYIYTIFIIFIALPPKAYIFKINYYFDKFPFIKYFILIYN